MYIGMKKGHLNTSINCRERHDQEANGAQKPERKQCT